MDRCEYANVQPIVPVEPLRAPLTLLARAINSAASRPGWYGANLMISARRP